jgi:hypothetical protein
MYELVSYLSTRPRHSRPDLVAHPHHVAMCCAPSFAIAAARRRRPRLSRAPLAILVPPVVAALHPPAKAIAEVCAAGDLRVIRGIELRVGVKFYNNELHSSKQ